MTNFFMVSHLFINNYYESLGAKNGSRVFRKIPNPGYFVKVQRIFKKTRKILGFSGFFRCFDTRDFLEIFISRSLSAGFWDFLDISIKPKIKNLHPNLRDRDYGFRIPKNPIPKQTRQGRILEFNANETFFPEFQFKF